MGVCRGKERCELVGCIVEGLIGVTLLYWVFKDPFEGVGYVLVCLLLRSACVPSPGGQAVWGDWEEEFSWPGLCALGRLSLWEGCGVEGDGNRMVVR